MNPMDSGYLAPEEFARHLEEQQRRMRQADALIYFAHSRTGLLARFLQRMADAIDPTGEARERKR